MSFLYLQAIVLGVIGYFALVFVLRKCASSKQIFGFCLLCAALWLSAVAYLTVLMRCPVLEVRVHLTPIVDAHMYSMMENVVLFLPFGSIFMGLFPRARARACMAAGVGASVTIELAQLLSHRGICDIDDLIANSIGVVVGALLFVAIRRLAGPRDAAAQRAG